MSLQNLHQVETIENLLSNQYILSAQADTYIANDLSIRANDNQGFNSYLAVGTGRNGEPDRNRTLLRFELGNLENTSVDSAILRLIVKNYAGYGVPLPNALHTIEVHRIIESGSRTPWIEGNGFVPSGTESAPMPGSQHPDPAFGVAWFGAPENSDPNANNNLSQPNIDPSVIATAQFLQQSTPSGTIIEWDITSLVNGWLSGAFPNYGITLVDSSPGYGGQSEVVLFESRENEIYGNVSPSDSFNGSPGPKLVLSMADSEPLLSINNFSISEGDTGAKNASFTVTLSKASDQIVTVEYQTANGAVETTQWFEHNGHKYALTKQAKTWEEAQLEAQQHGGNLVTINNATEEQWLQSTFGTSQVFWIGLTDKFSEGNFVWISGEPVTYTNWHIGEPNNANNNHPLGPQNYGIMNSYSDKKWDDFFVSGSVLGGADIYGIIEVNNTQISDSQATAGVDYTPKSGTLTFNPGETTKTISIPIIGDTVVENDETFFVNLSNATNATITDNQGVCTIENDDSDNGGGNQMIQNYTFNLKQGIVPASPTPFITIHSAPYLNPEYGYYEAVFKVNLNDPALANPYQKAIFTVTYDIVPTSGMITVNIGDSRTDNCGGGDSGTQSNDAEMYIGNPGVGTNPRNFEIAGNDNAPSSSKYTAIENFLPNSPGTVHLTAADKFLAWDNRQGVQGNLTSPYLFALNGQPDSEGPVNYDIFAAFNRVIDGNYRNGGGVSQVTITLLESDIAPQMGTPGNETLKGTVGADTMIGLGGNDTYTVNHLGDVVFESASEGTDAVKANVTYALPDHVENLTLTGTGNLDGTGNALNNKLTGNNGNNILMGGAGNDTLDGKAGNDLLQGETGNDTYLYRHPGSVIVENANEGTDTVKASISYTLPDHVEKLTLTGSAAINGTGNTLKNTLIGNSAANILNGGAGSDALTGKGGADIFLFRFGESEASTAGRDRITDFAIGTDKIDLLTQSGSATGAPVAFTRAADTTATNLNPIVTGVFADANGVLAGFQPLGVNSAALVKSVTETYLIVNDANPGFQLASDLLINIHGYTGSLDPVGAVPVDSFFV